MEGADVFLQGLPAGLDGCKRFCINGFRLQVLRNATAEVLVREHHGTVDEVAENGHQLAVVPALEVLPGEVVVFGLRCVGREAVAQHVLLARELLLIFVHPHGPAARSAQLVALQVQELVGRHVVRKYVVPIGLEHGREHDAVEHNVVLADEMHQPRFGVLPPFLPALGQQFLRIGNVADGRVEPDVKYLALGAFHGDGHAPVQVPAHRTGQQAAVQPALALAVHIGLPFLVLLQDPFAEPGLVAVQRQVPVLGLHLGGHGAGKRALGVDELFRRKGGAALLALVPIGIGIAALGAGAGDIAVCQEGLGLGIVELLALLGDELVVVIELAEELRGIPVVHRRSGAGIDVEVDAQARESVFHHLVVLVHDLLRGNPGLAGLDGDGYPVFVAAADEQHVFPAHAQVSYIDVSGDIGAGQMADVDGTVGVGKRTGHEGSFVAHLCNLPNLIFKVFFISVRCLSSCMSGSTWS